EVRHASCALTACTRPAVTKALVFRTAFLLVLQPARPRRVFAWRAQLDTETGTMVADRGGDVFSSGRVLARAAPKKRRTGLVAKLRRDVRRTEGGVLECGRRPCVDNDSAGPLNHRLPGSALRWCIGVERCPRRTTRVTIHSRTPGRLIGGRG